MSNRTYSFADELTDPTAQDLARLAEDILAQLRADETVGVELAAAAAAELRRIATERPQPLRFSEHLVESVLGDVAEWRQRCAANMAAGHPAIAGIPTGFTQLDERLNGLGAGYYVVQAFPGEGKTSLVSLIGYQVARRVPVVYVTFSDNTPNGLVLKHLARLAEVNTDQIQKGKVQPEALQDAAEWYRDEVGSRLAYLEGTSRIGVGQLQEWAEQALERHKADRVLVVVDYLQQLAAATEGDSYFQKIGRISQDLARLSRDLKSPVLAISSMPRSAMSSNSAAGFGGTKGGTDIEFDADVLMQLRAPTKDEREKWGATAPGIKPKVLTIIKNRMGGDGDVRLDFTPARGDFAEVEDPKVVFKGGK